MKLNKIVKILQVLLYATGILSSSILNTMETAKLIKKNRDNGIPLFKTPYSMRKSNFKTMKRNFDLNRADAKTLIGLLKKGTADPGTEPSKYGTFKCFSYTIESYQIKIDKSIETYSNKCSILVSNEDVKKYLDLLNQVTNLEARQTLNPKSLTEEFINSVSENYPEEPNIVGLIKSMKTSLNRGLYNFSDINKAIENKLLAISSKLYAVDTVKLGLQRLISYSREKVLLAYLATITDVTTCLPVDWNVLTTYITNNETKEIFDWESSKTDDLADDKSLNLLTMMSFWTYENKQDIINDTKQKCNLVEITNDDGFTEDFTKFSAKLIFNINSSGKIIHQYVQSLTTNNMILNSYLFKNAYDINFADERLSHEPSAFQFISNSTCPHWNFHVLFMKRLCDHYEIFYVQKSSGMQVTYVLSFKLKIEDIFYGHGP